MDKVIETAIRTHHERMAQALACETDIAICREVMPADTYFWLDNEINASCTFNSMDEVKEVLRKFAQKGIMIHKFNNSDTNLRWQLKGVNTTISFTPHWLYGEEAKEKGATCRLVKVSTKMVQSDQYKLICDDKEDVTDYFKDTVISEEAITESE